MPSVPIGTPAFKPSAISALTSILIWLFGLVPWPNANDHMVQNLESREAFCSNWLDFASAEEASVNDRMTNKGAVVACVQAYGEIALIAVLE